MKNTKLCFDLSNLNIKNALFLIAKTLLIIYYTLFLKEQY